MHQSHQSSSGIISGSSSVADRPKSHRASAIETFGLANGNPNSVSSGVFFKAYQPNSCDYTMNQSQPAKNYSTNPPSTSNSASNAAAALAINERVAEQINDEIQRFESVHPCIYTIYSLIESISNYNLQQQIREQVIQIEDAFVNSEEWTLSRSVHKIKMGVVGSLDSGKTSLVHYYLTGKPTKELTPEGGRFKSEIVVDGKSYMLLIRDEGEFSPEAQFTRWIDGVMIAFSLENRNSYLIALQYFKRMASHRNMNDIPVFLVGILDSPDESRREISVDEARKTSSTMKMSSYVEWHSSYGMDVRKIFVSACQRILQHNRRLNRSSTVSGGDNSSSQCLNVGGNKCASTNVSNFVNNNGVQQDYRQQFCTPNSFGITSGSDRNYHHQRSVSAVPINENQSSISHNQNQQYAQSAYQHYHQQSPPSSKGSSAAVLRRSHQPAAINTTGRPSGSLANVPASCTSSASTFYQELEQLPRSDSFTQSGGAHQHPPPQVPLHSASGGNGFRYDNTIGRASATDYHKNCSTFMLPAGGQSVQSAAPSNQQRFSERMSTNMEFAGGATNTGGTMSPAFSHNSLSSQYSGSNSVCPSYSRSTSNVGGSNSASSTTANRRKIPEDMVLFNHSAGGNATNNYRFNTNYYQGHPSGIASTTALLGGDGSTDNCHFGSMATTASASQILPTPSSTPNTQRKNRRISNIFRTGKDSSGANNGKDHGSGGVAHFNEYSADPTLNSGSGALLSMGVGREIPIREGVLYKRSNKALNREWKKKYVCLYADGRLRYHQNHKEYRHDSGAKELYLGLATVRVSGRKVPRATNRNSLLPQQQQSGGGPSSTTSGGVVLLPMVDDALAENGGGTSTAGDAGTSCNSDGGDGAAALVTSTSSIIGQLHHQELSNNTPQSMQAAITSSGGGSGGNNIKKVPTTNIKAKKKRGGHKKLGSGTKNNEDEDDCEFEIISSDQKHWEFSAATVEERDEWVDAIEGLIEKCLQSQLSQKQQQNNRVHGDKADVQALKQLPGNDVCADCSTPRPDWASLNLGTLICIECSGIHRNLGSHISRVRSLDLDDWPMENLVVMQAIGNQLANNIWENTASLNEKPGPDSSREQKELWIKKKYEQKEFLQPPWNTVSKSESLTKRLIDAVLERNLPALLTVLPRASEEDVNGMVNGETDRRTALHLACSIGAAEIVQLLIWHNADIYVLDESQHSALWFARLSGSQECESILLNAGLTANYGVSSANNADGDANTTNTNSGKNSSNSSAGSTLINNCATRGNNDDSTLVMPTGAGNDTTIYVGGNVNNAEFTSFNSNAYGSLKLGSRKSTESVMMPPPFAAAENRHHRRSDFITPSSHRTTSPTKFTASTFNPMELSSAQSKTAETPQFRRQSDFVQKRIAGLTVGSGANFSTSPSPLIPQDNGNATTMKKSSSNATTNAASTATAAFQCLPASVI